MEGKCPGRRIAAPRKARKVSFLIHPGFIGDCGLLTHSDLEKRPEGSRISDARKLFGRYKSKAKRMGPDELLIGFSHHTREELAEEFKNMGPYGRMMAENLRELKQMLGRRFIFLSGDFEIFGESFKELHRVSQTVKTIKEISESRGLIISRDTRAEAFGETLGSCVPDAAEALNEAIGFESDTLIITRLCDVDVAGGLKSDDLRAWLSSVIETRKRIRYSSIIGPSDKTR